MLLGNNRLHCCCRTLFRATLKCKLPPSTSLYKHFSVGASSVLARTSRVLLESVTRGKPATVDLSYCSRTATLRSVGGNPAALHSVRCNPAALHSVRCNPALVMDWFHAKRRSHSGPAPPTLNFDVLKGQKFDEDILLYSNSNMKECVVYNVLALVAFGLMSYAAYIIYAQASLDPTQEDWEQRNNILDAESIVPLYRYFDLVPYREVLSGTCFLFGCLIIAAILRYTLRCVHLLTLLKDGKTIVFTTSNIWGRPVTRRVLVKQAHTEGLNDFVRGYDTCLLHVQGSRVAYALDMRGKLHEPFMLRQYLGTEVENKKKDDPVGN